MPFADKTVQTFLDELASSAPVPGGGSGAALGGAMGAALLSMVCNLTLGKKGYETVQDEMAGLLEQIESLRHELLQLMEADTQVYGQFRDTFRMPRKTDEEKATRQEAMQCALAEAARVPMSIAECCRQLVDLALPVAQLGNKGVISDGGAGVLMAEAALQAAILNVQVNLKSMSDANLVSSLECRIRDAVATVEVTRANVLATVAARMS